MRPRLASRWVRAAGLKVKRRNSAMRWGGKDAVPGRAVGAEVSGTARFSGGWVDGLVG